METEGQEKLFHRVSLCSTKIIIAGAFLKSFFKGQITSPNCSVGKHALVGCAKKLFALTLKRAEGTILFLSL